MGSRSSRHDWLRRSSFTLLIAVAITTAACQGSDATSTADGRAPSGGSSPQAPLRTSAHLDLAAGERAVSFHVSAPDPNTYSFVVYVSMSRRSVLNVGLRTQPGEVLHVLSRERTKQACRMSAGGWRCKVIFPVLEAQPAGQWTMLVRKLSQPPVRLEFRVVFSTIS